MRDETPKKGPDDAGDGRAEKAELSLGSRSVPLPQYRALRIALGFSLVVLGVGGILPVLGFWMIPLGLAVLAVDVPGAARLRDRLLDRARGLRERWRRG